ncbi:MAG: hypothetical protein KKF62_09960 [Bacteroidetes bacterium]|nr:hypothetical protein [Bacteroidota bacterium]MBU1116593.1 hypothetical protein [Bacteroidota bacterium]MBU1797185.1 hypothetical protein [Bacteroidota bacterium]
MKINSVKIKLIYLLMFLSINICLAQTINLQTLPDTTKQFGFSFDKTFYSSNYNMSAFSGVYQVYLNIPISSKLNLISSIPYINTNYDFETSWWKYHYEKQGIGNIFIGIQTNKKIINNSRSVFSVGVYLPTAEKNAAINGLYSNYYDLQKFAPNTMGIYVNYAHHRISRENFNVVFEVGPNFILPTGDNNANGELFIHYGFDAGYKANNLLFDVELLGVVILTEDIDNISDRFVNMLNFGTQWKGSVVSPKIFYKIYLKDEISDMIDGVLGIGVTVAID